jgi:hypothetical protein
MKKSYLLLFILPLLFAMGCKKETKPKETSIEVNFQESAPFLVPFDLDVLDSQITLQTFSFETNTNSVLASKNSNKDLLEEAFIEYIRMNALAPDTLNFNFLKDIEVYMLADGLPEILGAYYYDIPNTKLRLLELETTKENMKEYLKKDALQLKIKVTLREVLKQGSILKMDINFKGKTGLL